MSSNGNMRKRGAPPLVPLATPSPQLKQQAVMEEVELDEDVFLEETLLHYEEEKTQRRAVSERLAKWKRPVISRSYLSQFQNIVCGRARCKCTNLNISFKETHEPQTNAGEIMQEEASKLMADGILLYVKAMSSQTIRSVRANHGSNHPNDVKHGLESFKTNDIYRPISVLSDNDESDFHGVNVILDARGHNHLLS